MPPKRKAPPEDDESRKRTRLPTTIDSTHHKAARPEQHISSEALHDDLETQLKVLTLQEASVANSKLHVQVELASRRVPRFLFRVWDKFSGGNEHLNTVNAITPHAFYHREGPSSIHDIPRYELASLASEHLAGSRHTSSPFSSWSQSFSFIVSWATQKTDGYISVIDTKRLGAHNKILYTMDMGVISQSIKGFQYECLAFGTISGSAHKAVSFRDIMIATNSDTVGVPGPLQKPLRLMSTKEAIQIRRVAELFGPAFALPVHAHILSRYLRMTTWEERREVLDILLCHSVPSDWAEDPTIVTEQCSHGNFRETAMAIRLMRALVREDEGKAAGQQIEGDVGGAEQAVAHTGQTAEQAVLRSSRVPRMVKELYIDLLGWGPGDLQIQDA